jgi:hypothetical protein
MYIIVAKKFKSAYSYCPNYILNDILSNFMVNKKVKHKNALRSKTNICYSTLMLGWLIRNKISTKWLIEKLKKIYDQ